MQARDQGSTQAVVFVLLFSSFDNTAYYTKPSFVPELLCIFLYDGVAIGIISNIIYIWADKECWVHADIIVQIGTHKSWGSPQSLWGK